MVGQGISFDAEFRLTVGDDGLRQALLAGSGRTQVYVLRQSNGGALGQLHFLEGDHHARLAYVAPLLEDDAGDRLWLCLLDGLAVMAGQRGVVTIIAEVDDTAPELELLRRAGFATYARQDIWLRSPAPVAPAELALRPAASAEEPVLMGLYGSIVPGLIKHVEPPPTIASELHVLDGARGAVGLMALYDGGQSALIEAYLASGVKLSPRAFLAAALVAAQADRRTICCRSREYMGCSADTLTEAGFTHLGGQAVMFRHTAVRVVHQSFQLKEKVNGGVPLPTSYVDGS